MSNLHTYAQVIRENSRVNLIGDESLGLSLFDLPMAYTVDITGRSDVKAGMRYDPATGEFSECAEPFVLAPQDFISDESSRDNLLIDLAYRLTLLELGVSK